MTDLVWLIPLLPLLGAILNGCVGSRIGKKRVGLIGCATVAAAFGVSVLLFLHLINLPAAQRSVEVSVFNWITSGVLQIDFAFLVDPLSTLMILVVTGVSFVIHIYSIGYMHDDPGYARFFCYLNLFVFFMLMLVLSANYVAMFLGWEGVGLCSYLLIGFWYEKKSASDAGKKAFVVNRIGDFGFILGIFLLFWSLADRGVYSLNFNQVFAHARLLNPGLLTAITLLLFVGAVGKSAQIPLYVWLPDAMEGPTPVSALIHAATMVTAGVYMVARNNLLYSLAPMTGEIVAAVGILTAFFAATIGLAQNDIKKVLAYSTISQLGYMFAAVGLGAYTAGIFHLMTHAFFKGLLFLAAGSVIHAMSGDQDMRHMGGLLKPLKTTSATFIIGAVAIAGVPPFSGFWSKDEILWEAFKGGHLLIWSLGLVTAGMTAFYMFRQVFMVFSGSCRADDHTRSHLHESPKVMTMPLMILAGLAVFGGVVGIPFFKGGSPMHNFLAPVFGHPGLEHAAEAAHAAHGTLEFVLMGLSVLVGIGGIVTAALIYWEPLHARAAAIFDAEAICAKYPVLYDLILQKYHMDEIYDAIVVNPVKRLCQYCLSFDLGIIDGLVNGAGWLARLTAWLSHKIDIYLVDGAVNSMATLVGYSGGIWRRLQTGYLQNYVLVFVLGLILIVGGVMLFS